MIICIKLIVKIVFCYLLKDVLKSIEKVNLFTEKLFTPIIIVVDRGWRPFF